MTKRMRFKLSTGEEFYFELNPQEYTVTTPARVNVLQTKGGMFADNFGSGATIINIKGITKNHFVATSTGEVRNKALDTFKQLRDGIVLGYFDGQVPGALPQRTMEFWNFTDEDYYEVIPMQFSLNRSATKPLFYNYDINLVVIRKLTDPESSPVDEIEQNLEKSRQYQQIFRLTPSSPTLLPDLILDPTEETPAPTPSVPLPFVIPYGDNTFLFNIQELSKTDLATYVKEHGYSFVPNLAYVSPDLANTKPTELGAILHNTTTGETFLVQGVDLTLPPNTIRIEIPEWKNETPTYLSVVEPKDVDYGILPIIRQVYSEQNYDTPIRENSKPAEVTTMNLLYPFEKLRMDYWIQTQSDTPPDPLEQQLLNREYERMQIVQDIETAHEYAQQVQDIVRALNAIVIPNNAGGYSETALTSDMLTELREAQNSDRLEALMNRVETLVFTNHLTETLPILHTLSDDIALEKKILLGVLERTIYPTTEDNVPLDINSTEAETLSAYGHVLGLERVVTDVLSIPEELREESESLAKEMMLADGLIDASDMDTPLADLYEELIEKGIFTGGTASAGLINQLHQLQIPGSLP